MDKNENISITEWLETHLGLITAATSILGIGITGIFKCISYWREKGYFDYWKIPVKYMEIDYFNILMQFLLNCSLTVIFLAFMFVYIEKYNSSKKLGRVVLHIIPFFVNAGIFTYAIHRVGGTIYDALNFSNKVVFKTFVGVEVILYILELMLIHIFKEKKSRKINIKNKNQDNQNKETKSNYKNDSSGSKEETHNKNKNEQIPQIKEEMKKIPFLKKVTFIYMVAIIIYIIAAINWTCFVFYNDRKENCEETNKFEVIQDENGQGYVILTTFKDQVFVRPCTVNEEQHSITINSDKYMLLPLGEKEVIVYDYSNYKSVFKMVSNNEYGELLKKNESTN